MSDGIQWIKKLKLKDLKLHQMDSEMDQNLIRTPYNLYIV